jgi:hypothetical protein
MVATLMVAMAAFTVLFAWLLILRLATLRTRTRLNRLTLALALAETAAGD